MIPVDNSMDMSAIQALDLQYDPAALASLWETYNKIEGEIYCLLGTMFNVEQNKAAGVGTAETIVYYSQTYALANSRLKQRQRWCEKVNEEFALGVWCDKSNDFQEIAQEMMAENPVHKEAGPKEEADEGRKAV